MERFRDNCREVPRNFEKIFAKNEKRGLTFVTPCAKISECSRKEEAPLAQLVEQ